MTVIMIHHPTHTETAAIEEIDAAIDLEMQIDDILQEKNLGYGSGFQTDFGRIELYFHVNDLNAGLEIVKESVGGMYANIIAHLDEAVREWIVDYPCGYQGDVSCLRKIVEKAS